MAEPKKAFMLAEHPYEEWPADCKPSEVAYLFRVDPKTVTRWANSGLIKGSRTAGKHRRFPKEEVYRLYTGKQAPSIPGVRSDG